MTVTVTDNGQGGGVKTITFADRDTVSLGEVLSSVMALEGNVNAEILDDHTIRVNYGPAGQGLETPVYDKGHVSVTPKKVEGAL